VETPLGPTEVRLLNVWIPEQTVTISAKTGLRSRSYLHTLLTGRKVYLIFDEGLEAGEPDRLLAYVQTLSGTLVNLELVRRGLSPYYFRSGPSRNFHDRFVAAERQAFKKRDGVWGESETRQTLWSLRQSWAIQGGLRTPRLGAGSPTHDIGWLRRNVSDDLAGGAIVITLVLAIGYCKAKTRSEQDSDGSWIRRFFRKGAKNSEGLSS
ncbi:thermonuclease family protein, partial [bacterium AH-315-F18]|nr:thermonuclease family protein [bacterium AH-315-F18]